MARTTKRPFQPSINSYFGSLSYAADHPTTKSTSSSPSPTLVPALPTTIQSSLLNVGMRIRKSVPEGYKTKRNAADASTAVAHTGSSTTISPCSMTPHYASSSPQSHTGLVPYCGILKTGDHTIQPTFPAPAEEDLPPLLHFDNNNEDDWSSSSSSFPSSQESNNAFPAIHNVSISQAMSDSPLQSIKKRRREEADDENLGLEFQSVSPRTSPISHTCMPNLDRIRAIAVPKSKKSLVKCGVDIGGRGGRESEMIDVDDDDFGEAAFWRPEDWEDDYDGGGEI